jgi:hypothetical protein
MEDMLRALAKTVDQLNNVELISASHSPKIRDQIKDNAALVDDIKNRHEVYSLSAI